MEFETGNLKLAGGGRPAAAGPADGARATGCRQGYSIPITTCGLPTPSLSEYNSAHDEA